MVNPQAEIIKSILKWCGYESYLELGIHNGDTFYYVASGLKRAHGVDVVDSRINKSGSFSLMTTDKFFSSNQENFDAIFIDAFHNYVQVKVDFSNSLKILNSNGIIFLHDTDPINESYTQECFCSDSYKMIDYIKSNYPDLDILTLPEGAAGLSLVRRAKDRRVLKFMRD